MPSLDRSRFIYSLAGEWLAREWTLVTMKATLRRATPDRPFRVPKLVERTQAKFATKPDFDQLVSLLMDDAGLARAMERASKPSHKRTRSPILRRPTVDDPPRRLAGIKLPRLETENALAEWFAMPPQVLRWRSDPAGRNRKHPAGPLRTYRYRWILRRNGPPRLLEIPKAALKQMQKKILKEILNPVPVHSAAHGFRAGRSIVTNAQAHCGKATVLRFDLVDFFPSVSSARIFRIFRTLGYPRGVAELLMGLCTTRLPADVWESRPGARDGSDFLLRERLVSRHLPQGAPTSPALANLAAGRLDRRLAGLAKAIDAAYTRYADDLAFSGGAELARSSKRLETLVAVIAHEEGFALNHRKTRTMRSGLRQQVTGVVVNRRPNITRSEFDRLKAILTNCARFGAASQNRQSLGDFRAHLAGKIAHVASIHPSRGEKLGNLFHEISWDEEADA